MKVAAFVLLFACLSFAQEAHRFLDKPARFALGGSAVLFATDALITCRNLGPNWHEGVLPAQSCAGVAAMLGADFAAQTSAAYFLHRRGHHRLERFVEMFGATASGVGITWNLSHKPIHPLPVQQPAPAPAAQLPIGIPCGTGCQM